METANSSFAGATSAVADASPARTRARVAFSCLFKKINSCSSLTIEAMTRRWSLICRWRRFLSLEDVAAKPELCFARCDEENVKTGIRGDERLSQLLGFVLELATHAL